MGEEELPNQEAPPVENDPLYISEDEAEQIQRLVDNGGMGYFQAVRSVFKDAARYDQYMQARGALDAQPTSERPASTTSRPARPAYRPKNKDQDDLAAAEHRDLERRDQERRDQPISAEDDAMNREMLERFSGGEFTPPDEAPKHQE